MEIYDKEILVPEPRKTFSGIGWRLAGMLVLLEVLRLVGTVVLQALKPLFADGSTTPMWLANIIIVYVIAFPLTILLLSKLPASKPESGKLGVKNGILYFCSVIGIGLTGNIIGIRLAQILTGGSGINPMNELVLDSHPLKILMTVILAPVLEELLFRKALIDRTRAFGEAPTVLLSGLTFGLMHGNFYQFFYAFGLGMLFGYIYVRTGKIRYTVIYHAIVNFMGTVVVPFLLSQMDMEVLEMLPYMETVSQMKAIADILPGLMLLMGYMVVYLLAAVIGVIHLIIRCYHLEWKPAEFQIPRGEQLRIMFGNPGMIVMIVIGIVQTVLILFE